MTTAPAPPRREPLSALCNFLPKQRAALRAVEDHRYTLYGGAAGGGKSHFLRWLAVILLVRWAKRGFRGVRVGLFSVDFPTLEDRQLSKVEMEYPDWLGTYNASKHNFTLKPQYGGGVVCFRNLDKPTKYKSSEFAAILLEEATENELAIFNLLRFRLRWPGIEDTKFVGATNPGGPGHLWCKQLWIDRDFTGDMKNLAEKADQFAYVKATVYDNPNTAQAYIDELSSLPDELRRAYLEGDWDIFAGQVFHEFRREIHVVEKCPHQEWWRSWLCNDPGHGEHAAWYLCAADQLGHVWVMREWTFQRVWYTEQARTVARDVTAMGVKPSFAVTGMDAFAARFESGKGITSYYEEGGIGGWREPDHGSGCRTRRAATVHEYLKPWEERYGEKPEEVRKVAKLRIVQTCQRLIMTLPNLAHDENEPEAVGECDSDHWYDALGYGLQAWHARRSTAPAAPAYKPGSAGDLLGHAKKLGGEKKKGIQW